MKIRALFILASILGIAPILLLLALVFLSWFAPAFLAVNFRFEAISFYIILIIPVVLLGLVLLLVSCIINRKIAIAKHVIAFLVIIIGSYTTYLLLPLHGNLSSRAYLEIENHSGKDILVLSVSEPDISRSFGILNNRNSKIIYYYPDYGTYNGKPFAGISENYVVLQLNNTVVRAKIPTTHPGELHHLNLDNNFGLVPKGSHK
jgi:hypothetical protein